MYWLQATYFTLLCYKFWFKHPICFVLSWKCKFQGGHIIFFQSLSLLGYCLFPLDVGAVICMLKDNVILKMIVVSVTLAWSSWAAYPFMSAAVNPRRKALALYPVFLMYVSVGFLIIAIDWFYLEKWEIRDSFSDSVWEIIWYRVDREFSSRELFWVLKIICIICSSTLFC